MSLIKHTPIRFKIFTKQYNILLTQKRYNILLTQKRIIYFPTINKKIHFRISSTNTNSENTLYTAPNFVNLEGKIINVNCI